MSKLPEYEDLSENPTLDSIAKIIGVENAAKLSKDFGGRRLHIPGTPGEHSPITVSIGLDLAEKISQIYGQMSFDVPLNFALRKQIAYLLENTDLTAPKIAEKLRCHRRTVFLVKAQIKNNPSKPDILPLFE